MSEDEAIQILIALAVCSDAKLSCDEDCPFYNENEEELLGNCNIEFENKLYEAVKVLNKKTVSQNIDSRKSYRMNNTNQEEYKNIEYLIANFSDIARNYYSDKPYIQISGEDVIYKKDIQDLGNLLSAYRKMKEENKELEKDNQKQWAERCKLAIKFDDLKGKIKNMLLQREFELQQEYKEFEDDGEWKAYKKILEEV